MRFAVRVAGVLALGTLLALVGCRAMAGLGILFSPRQIQKAEFELTPGRLALVIDHAHAGQADPVFDLNLHNRLVELFRDNNVPARVVPYDEVVRLRQANRDFSSWSIQRAGRRLNAEQVLYVRIEDLRLRPSSDDPVITPEVGLNVKVIGVREPTVHARLWPDKDAETEGRWLTHRRQPKEVENRDVIDAEAAKLARETAYYVARHFHKYDLEVKPPREP